MNGYNRMMINISDWIFYCEAKRPVGVGECGAIVRNTNP